MPTSLWLRQVAVVWQKWLFRAYKNSSVQNQRSVILTKLNAKNPRLLSVIYN
jgi:hypothetical protein